MENKKVWLVTGSGLVKNIVEAALNAGYRVVATTDIPNAKNKVIPT